GLRVVTDQVFNHTSASGQDDEAVLDRIVPGYYHRLDAKGAIETSTCCQNIATENVMAGKMMVDSVELWATQYGVDGFRFDLMGHHTLQNMVDIREMLDGLTLEKDGVNGKEIYLYGEGWDFGEVEGDALFKQATQANIGGTGIGAFNDRLRDAVRGGGPFDSDQRTYQGFGSGLYTDPNEVAQADLTEEEQLESLLHQTDLVRIGLAGNVKGVQIPAGDGGFVNSEEIDYNGVPAAYALDPQENVNYVDAHDNETLFDNLVWKLPTDATMDTQIRMNTLSLATATLGQSPSFWHAGTDMLRSKSLDRDSYNSGDHFNAIDWTMQTNGYANGLPMKGVNGEKWPLMTPLLENASKVPAPEDIEEANEMSLDLLKVRSSSPLFSLGSGELVKERVSFTNGGAGATPGLLVMQIDDAA
ncbi:alpha-1,6-glucosidase domain-containing protein, partial [Ancrocorticia populi]|uniref:alpha-1,6-glucosidase domain-containing protein n=1 Tax=Ancrocorticia populi TaxID=2175228 RepID=UPI003F9A8A38